jgi:hypothetical protein
MVRYRQGGVAVDSAPTPSLGGRWFDYLADLGRFDLGAPLSSSGRRAIDEEWARLDRLDGPTTAERVELLIAFCVRLGMPADRVRARTLVGSAQARRRPADSPHAALDRRRAAEARQRRPNPTKGPTK